MALALIISTFVSLCGLTATSVYGYLISSNPQGFSTHFLLAVPSTFIALFSHCMTMFYFIGSGKWLKEQKDRYQLEIQVLPTILGIKKKYFGPAMLVILWTMVATILGGGAHTRAIPGWVHGVIGLAAVASNLYLFIVQIRYLALNNMLMQEVAVQVDKLEEARGQAGP